MASESPWGTGRNIAAHPRAVEKAGNSGLTVTGYGGATRGKEGCSPATGQRQGVQTARVAELGPQEETGLLMTS